VNDIVEELKKLEEQRNRLIKKIQEIDKKMLDLRNKLFEASDDYVKIVCPKCNKKGVYRDDKGKLRDCPVCNGDRYIWALVYKEDK